MENVGNIFPVLMSYQTADLKHWGLSLPKLPEEKAYMSLQVSIPSLEKPLLSGLISSDLSLGDLTCCHLIVPPYIRFHPIN